MRKVFFTVAVAIVVLCAFIMYSCEAKSNDESCIYYTNECYIHYTPEELDVKTQAYLDVISKNGTGLPSTAEKVDSAVKVLKEMSYEEYSATHPEFSQKFSLDTLVDKNGFRTLKLICKSNNCSKIQMSEANLIYIHGGGFLFHFSSFYRDICELLADRMNFTVYIPLYPLAPNYYVQTTLDMLLELYRIVKAEGKPVYVMGDSAGGNLCLSFPLYLKSVGEPLPDALLPISPQCDFDGTNPKLPEYNKTDIVLPMPLLEKIREHWKPMDMDSKDPRVSPLYGDWKGISQTFIFAGTYESLYPEIEDIYQRMKNAGMRVGMLVGYKLCHDAPLMDMPVREQYIQEITEFLYGSKKAKCSKEAKAQ